MEETLIWFERTTDCYGLIIAGPGGVGKDHLINKHIAEHVRHSGHITARGLFNLLRKHHQQIIVLSDVDGLLKQDAVQILKAALDPIPERIVSWVTAKGAETFCFEGKMIILTNALGIGPHIEALTSRCDTYYYEPSDKEYATIIHEIADEKKLDADIAFDVANHLESFGVKDLRRFKLALQKADQFPSSWKKMLKNQYNSFGCQNLVKQLKEDHIPAVIAAREFTERTGKSVRTFYRLWNQV